ncbi:MAG: copper resistance protein CopD [Phenylobacterium sp.]|uniref:copper homeostasis membrane protein CopD n=1 Tax=Phenylobacterium sp. TaxID=1871053 RepID=UPI001218E2A5|nr:copper homeostasis membrane protein CopD [Phenylobacterium sp.]TAJ71730.1 MAG: copper resistance protein CopD [Phenylobacterium sp.]
MHAAVVALRLLQFAAAVVLFGAPLFLLYGLKAPARDALPWPRPLAIGAGLALCAGAVAGLLAQTAVMAGDPSAAWDGALLMSVGVETPFGRAALARAVAAMAALVLVLVMTPGRRLWWALSVLGAAAVASLAWSGHGAATEGPGSLVHLVADILHLLAAGVWIGALAAFGLLLRAKPFGVLQARALHGALAGFSGVGSAVVATLVLTGLVNSWFLVGPQGLARLAATGWGVLMLAKLAVFAVMLGLAAVNRFRLTPALAAGAASGDPAALAGLRRSLALETGAAVLVLALVAALGTLPPPAAA